MEEEKESEKVDLNVKDKQKDINSNLLQLVDESPVKVIQEEKQEIKLKFKEEQKYNEKNLLNKLQKNSEVKLFNFNNFILLIRQ